MEGTFYYAEAFNQPIGSWGVSSVTTMATMFMQAKSFNQPLADGTSRQNSRSAFMFAFQWHLLAVPLARVGDPA